MNCLTKREFANGLRAAFKVMLRENLERVAGLPNGPDYWGDSGSKSIYRILTGEEWPR